LADSLFCERDHLAIGLESIIHFLQNPRTIDFYIETVVAVVMIWFGARFLMPGITDRKEKDHGDADTLNGWKSFGIGPPST
jgi:hypothetical protein